MSARRKPRFEVVHSDAGWFARFVAANGRKAWQTEVYRKRVDAIRAIEVITEREVYGVLDGLFVTGHRGVREVRTVDERSAR